MTRHYYGPRNETTTLCDDRGHAVVYPTRAEAVERVREIEGGEYKTASGELGWPTYRVVKAD